MHLQVGVYMFLSVCVVSVCTCGGMCVCECVLCVCVCVYDQKYINKRHAESFCRVFQGSRVVE